MNTFTATTTRNDNGHPVSITVTNSNGMTVAVFYTDGAYAAFAEGIHKDDRLIKDGKRIKGPFGWVVEFDFVD